MNEYDAILAGDGSKLRETMVGATQTSPDDFAEATRLARETGLPAEVVQRNKEQVRQRVQLNEYDALLTGSPGVAQRLADDPGFARLAHDDVPNLAEIERSFQDAQRQGRAVRGRVDEPFSRPGDRRTSQGRVGELFVRRGEMAGEERGIVGGVTEPVRRGLAQGDRGLTLLDLFPGLRERRDAARTAAGMAPSGNLDLAQQLATQQREVERFPVPEGIQRGQQEISAATTMGEAAEAILRNPAAVLEVSLQSLGISAPALAGAVAGSTVGPLGTAAGAGMGSFVVEYANTLQEVMAESGVDGKDALAVSAALGKPELMAAAREKAVKRGIPIALFDALTAGLAGRILAGARGTAGSIVPRIGGELGLQAGGGAAGEAVAQAVTDEYKPGDILLEALAELPSAIVEVPANYSSAVERAQAKAQQAERISQLAEASKLRARDPEAFKAFIEQVAQTGEGPAEFFIDAQELANTLNQGSITMEELQAMAPTVAKQLQGGFVPGADIRVPVTEFAAAPAEITTALIDHLRESPEAMSRAEAQRFLSEQGEQIKQDVEKTLETTASRAELQAEVAKVTEHFKAQLDAVGKFRPEVNQAYATVLGNYFTTQAQRAGMSVDEFMERYQLKVGKGGKSQPARQRQLDQQFSRGAGGASTADTMRSELQARFGDIVQALESKGVLRLWDGIEAFNQGGQASALPADMAGIQGMFAQGVANLFGDGIEAGNAVAVFLHEVGEHASMRDMLGPRYKELVRRAYQLVKEGDPIAQRALMRIPDDTPRKFYDSEMVAYLIEEATLAQEPSPGIAQWLADVVAAVRAFFFAKGLDIELSPQDVAALAVRAVRWQAQQEGRVESDSTVPALLSIASEDAQSASAEAATLIAAYREQYGADPKGMPLEKFKVWMKERTAAGKKLTADILALAEKPGLLVLPMRGNAKTLYVLHRDTKRDGAWRTTYVRAENMEPSGHTEYNKPEEAAHDFWSYAAEKPHETALFSKAPQQTESAEFKAWFGDSKVVDKKGKPLVLYHGTTADFDAFDRERANPESDFGAGFYFTNTAGDVANNYAGLGPDLTNKIQMEAERIASETDRDYSDPEVVAEARAKWVQHEGATVPVYLKMENPAIVGGKGETVLTYEEVVDEDGEFTGDEKGTLVDFILALRDTASQYEDGDVEGAISALLEEASGDSIGMERAIEILSSNEEFGYYTDENGRLVSKEIIRLALQAAGFDGVIDQTVDKKFGSQRRVGQKMKGMTKATVHYIAFEPEQIKSAIGNRGTFDPNDPNILNQPAFHGSPHQFDKFSLDKIGTGEGAQAFGWGLYFTENKAIAEHYRKTLSDSSPNSAVFLNGERVANNTPEHHAASLLFYNDNREIKATAKRWLKEMAGNEGMADTARKAGLTPEEYWTRLNAFVQAHNRKQIDIAKGQTYEVEVPDDEVLLLWDKPMSAQTAFVKQKLAEAGVLKEFKDNMSDFASPMDSRGKGKGQNLYAYLAWKHGGERQASEFLNSIGIPGHKFKQNTLTGNPGKGYNFVIWNEDAVTMLRTLYQGDTEPRGTLSFGNDITAVPSIIALLEDADLSTFLHESGHWFLEVQSDLAHRVQRRIFNEQYTGEPVSDSERQIVRDMEAILGWFGIQATPERSALDAWSEMTLEEKREHHEKWARGFEKYVEEGRAPTLELQTLFSKFRAWVLDVYRALGGLDVKLTDEVRQVMDRMLASDEAIAEAQMARDMGPLFESPEAAGMTPAEFRDYQALGARQTAEASAELDKRLMADMKWLSRARDKALKARQEEVEDLRREVRAEIRGEVMATPVYRAWAFLTGKLDRVDAAKKPAQVGEETENLFAAIGRLGGLDREEVKTKWGISSKDDNLKSGLFGKPLLRKEGGLSIDAMAERLIEAGYLLPDENGKADLAKFEALFDDQRRGIDRFSIRKDYEAALGEAPAEPLDLPVSASGRLNTDELKRMYGDKPDAKWRLLSERRMTSPNGLDPEEVAVTFGFTSADHLVDNLVRAAPPQAVIEEMTDRAMLERYGDIASPESLARAADEAVHNEVRARVVAAELRAMEKANTVREGKRSTVNVIARAAKDYAYQIIARQRVRDLRPSQYAAAQARSAKLARQALGKSTEEVALHKRNELINTYAARAAYDAQEEVRALQRYFRKFDKRLDSIDPGYQDQIEQLLERFDFKPASLKAIDRRKSFAAWYAEQEAAGNAPAVPDELLAEANRKSYKDMTVEELRGLRDTVKQIEHQGRLKKKLLLARDERDFEAIAKQMAASIEEHGGQRREVELEGPNPVVDWFAGLAASHRKLASLFRQMDGNNDNGPLWQFIGRPMNERSTMEEVMLEQATVSLAALYEPLTKMRGGITGKRSKLFIPEINDSLTRGGRLAVALNWGNEANRQRLQDGNRWSVDQVQAVLKTLTPEELAFVNGVWEFLDSYWPEIAAKEKRLTGVEPPKVEAAPFNVLLPDGTEVAMRGGYYPLKYDTNASDRAEQQEAAQVAKEMMQGAFTRATTRRGHTKERLKEVKRKVRLDLNVITQHVTQVVHDLAWHEWLIDTNKLVGDERISGAIRDFYGPKVLKTIRDDILGIATADVIPQTDIDRALLTLRTNVTRATMGASLTTAFLQPFGLTQSIVRIGGRHVLRGLARWGGDAARMENAVAWINERSEFMRLRGKTFNRELREIRGSVAGKSKAMKVVDAGLFVFMRKMQLVADVPTWLGQYEKSLSEGLSEADAIAMADRAVLESQGGGAIKDMAEVQRKHPMLTQFYSYFSVTLNLTAESTAATNFRSPAAVAGWLGDMALLLVIPAILPSFILYSLRGGDDDEPEDLAKKVAQWQIGYLLGTVVGLRELSGAISGFDYAGPPVGRIISDIGKAGKQTAQGELDEPLVLAFARLMGDAFGIPVTQILRSYKGWKAWDEGEEGAGPQSVLFGPPEKD